MAYCGRMLSKETRAIIDVLFEFWFVCHRWVVSRGRGDGSTMGKIWYIGTPTQAADKGDTASRHNCVPLWLYHWAFDG